jgi:abequosyltransferase
MAKKALSICIATYNRAQFIGATLESILPQLTDDVEVLVVDGASPDNTEEVVRRYCDQCSQLKYIRLANKGGVDQDFDRAVGLAEGEFCWLFSDDDILKPGAIPAVLDAIREDYNLVVVNSEIRNVDLTELLAERKWPMMTDRVYEDNPSDKDRFLAEVGDYLTFIGGVVIRRSVWLSRDRAKYYNTRFIHVGVIFQSMLPGKMLVIATPWIVIRLGNAEWASLGFDIWMFKWPELIWSFTHFSEDSKRAVCRPLPWQRLHTLIYYRALGIYSPTEYSRWLACRLKFRWQRLTARMISLMPFWIAQRILRIYAAIHRDRLLIYNLRNSRACHR